MLDSLGEVVRPVKETRSISRESGKQKVEADALLLHVGFVRRSSEVPCGILHRPDAMEGGVRSSFHEAVVEKAHVWLAIAAFDGRCPY